MVSSISVRVRAGKKRCRAPWPVNGCSKGSFSSDTRGFTLIEVMVALVILAIGILGAASMQINSIQGNSRANKMTEASLVASERADLLLDLDFDSPDLIDGAEPVRGYTVAWGVVDSGADTRDITVTVSWQEGGVARSFNYRFLKVRKM